MAAIATLKEAQEEYQDALVRWNNAQSDRAERLISACQAREAYAVYLEARGEYILASVLDTGAEPDDL